MICFDKGSTLLKVYSEYQNCSVFPNRLNELVALDGLILHFDERPNRNRYGCPVAILLRVDTESRQPESIGVSASKYHGSLRFFLCSQDLCFGLQPIV
jgi:hypothetical protein